MAKILIIDDLNPKRNRIKSILEDCGHTVDSIPGIRTRQLINETVKWLKKNEPEFDFLILDMQFVKEKLGGIHLYSRLESEGYSLKKYFKNIIVLTKLLKTGTDEELEKIEDFLSSSKIPPKNLVPIDEHLHDLISRIDDLIKKNK